MTASAGLSTDRTVGVGSVIDVCRDVASLQVPVGPPAVTAAAVRLKVKPAAGQVAVAALLHVTVTVAPDATAEGAAAGLTCRTDGMLAVGSMIGGGEGSPLHQQLKHGLLHDALLGICPQPTNSLRLLTTACQ